MERFWLRSTRPHALLATALVAVLAAPLLGPAPAGAQAPPAELRVLCVEREDKVAQATSPSDCKGREQSILVPEHRPVHLCARDDFGLVRYTTDPAACTRDHEFPVTIPDSGPQILCSKNIKNGRVQERGELRWASNAAGCDSKFYTPFVTPAAPVAVDDAYTIDEDSLLTVAARGVLDNDADVAGGTLRASLVDGPEVGAVVLAPDGSFTYDPRGLFDDLDAPPLEPQQEDPRLPQGRRRRHAAGGHTLAARDVVQHLREAAGVSKLMSRVLVHVGRVGAAKPVLPHTFWLRLVQRGVYAARH